MDKIINYLIVSLFFLTSCSTFKVESSGTDIKEGPAIIKVGITTKEEITKAFGKPSNISKKDDSEYLLYESRTVETPTYIGGLVINEAGRVITLKRLEIVVREGTVQSYKFEVGEK